MREKSDMKKKRRQWDICSRGKVEKGRCKRVALEEERGMRKTGEK